MSHEEDLQLRVEKPHAAEHLGAASVYASVKPQERPARLTDELPLGNANTLPSPYLRQPNLHIPAKSRYDLKPGVFDGEAEAPTQPEAPAQPTPAAELPEPQAPQLPVEHQ